MPCPLPLKSKPFLLRKVVVAAFCISIAADEVVAVPATVVVEIYRFPPAFLKVHWLKPAPAERASWEAVAENGFNSQVGVVVPMPTLPALVMRM